MIANLVKKPSETFSSVNDLSTPVYILFLLAGASLDLNILKTSGIVILLSVVYIFARGLSKYTGATVGENCSIPTDGQKVFRIWPITARRCLTRALSRCIEQDAFILSMDGDHHYAQYHGV